MYLKVKSYLEKNNMIRTGDTVLMGISGGGDSMTMLHMMSRIKKETDISLIAVHIQHGIRGKEAERDSELVKRVCEEWDIPCKEYHYDVPMLAKEWKMGIEETGRIVRKESFAKEIEQLGTSADSVKIALAHNKNDLAETMLHNLARGSGLRGMAGIQLVSGNIIRPLLCLERKEIDEYLLYEGIPFVTDSTNLEDHYTRNRIRHHILPLMESEINEQAVIHMAEAAEKIAAADEYFRKKAHKLKEIFMIAHNSYCLTLKFGEIEPVLRNYVVMEILESLAGKRKDLTQFHVEQVLECELLQTGKYICLPYNIIVRKDYQGIIIERKDNNRLDISDVTEQIWKLPSEDGEFHMGNDFYIKIFPYTGQKIFEKKYTKWFDYDKIQKDLSVRARKSGDYITIDKSGKKKKITRYMIDEKIPKEERDSWLLLAEGAEILWVVGGRISENYKISQQSKRVLEVIYKGENDNG